jgi:hypothetical protein
MKETQEREQKVIIFLHVVMEVESEVGVFLRKLSSSGSRTKKHLLGDFISEWNFRNLIS